MAAGGFEAAWVFKRPYGTNTITDTGVGSQSGDKRTIRGDTTGTVVRPVKVDGDGRQMVLADFGTATVTWSRVR